MTLWAPQRHRHRIAATLDTTHGARCQARSGAELSQGYVPLESAIVQPAANGGAVGGVATRVEAPRSAVHVAAA
jgi:hypothetical protein